MGSILTFDETPEALAHGREHPQVCPGIQAEEDRAQGQCRKSRFSQQFFIVVLDLMRGGRQPRPACSSQANAKPNKPPVSVASESLVGSTTSSGTMSSPSGKASKMSEFIVTMYWTPRPSAIRLPNESADAT